MSPSKAVLGAFLVAMSMSTIMPGSDPGKVLDSTVCGLFEQPLKFANLYVRIHGTLATGPEFFGLVDEACPSSSARTRLWLESTSPDMVQYNRGWSAREFIQATRTGLFKGGGPDLVWETSAPVRPLDPRQLVSVGEVVAASGGRPVRVVATGRFDYAADGLLVKSADGHFMQQAAYGHLNCCAGRIVLESIMVDRDGK